ncbi:MAG: aldehyde dehydrogenase family protein, partial [Halomonas sp.]
MKTLSHYLNGQHIAGRSQRTSPVYNPATGEQSAQVTLASAGETRDAVRIADEAFVAWSKTSPLKRARILFKFKALVEEHTDELARLISSE